MGKKLTGIVLVASGAAGVWWLQTAQWSDPKPKLSISTASESPAESAHPNFRHSVIPRGARSKEELAQKLEADPVAAAHYRDVNVAKLEPARLAKPRTAYVSYRQNGKIYWTSKPVTLAEGELVLTGGGETVRARCGNRVSAEFRLPVAKQEPPIEELDVPELPPGRLTLSTAAWPAVTWPGPPTTELASQPMVTNPTPGASLTEIAGYAGVGGLGTGPLLGIAPGAGGGLGGGGGAGSAPVISGPSPGDSNPSSPGAEGSQPSGGTPPPGGAGGGGGGSSGGTDSQPPTSGPPKGANPPETPSNPPDPKLPLPITDPKTPNPPGSPPGLSPPLDPPNPPGPTADPPPAGPPPLPPPPLPPPTVPPKHDPPDPMAPVPEPATVGWIAASLAAMAALRMRRTR